MALSTVQCLTFEIYTLASFRADILFHHNFMILLHTSKQVSSNLVQTCSPILPLIKVTAGALYITVTAIF